MADRSEPAPACRDAASQLALCLQANSPCVKNGGTVIDCLKVHDTESCDGLRRAFFECRRSQLDMRTRIRGRRFHDTE
jgi:cytochrome c oxidase assembly factor 5